jgi:DEAD/DEAH box helicase domain-containing protein
LAFFAGWRDARRHARSRRKLQATLSTPPALPIIAPFRKRRAKRRVEIATAMTKNIVFFDLETQKSANEVGGWNHVRDMLMSVGVTYSSARDEYRIFGEQQIDALLMELQRADLVVGFNHLRFDYEVLHHYTVLDLRQIPTLDLMLDLQAKLQHRLSLDAVASATLGVEKTAEGLQAIQWFREGKLLELAEYCCYDVKITRMVYDYGVAHGRVFYNDRFGRKKCVEVDWGGTG